MNIFWGMKILWGFLGVITKLDKLLGSFRVLWLRYRIGIFFGLLKFQKSIFGVLNFPDIFLFLLGGGGGGE